MQLYVIRHAQSENNVLWARTNSEKGRKSDPRLTAVGHQQADYLAQFLSRTPPPDLNGNNNYNQHGFGLTHLYTSLMLRAVATGLYISRATGLPLVAWEEIHEWGGIHQRHPETGELEGLPGPNAAFFAHHFPDLILPETMNREGWWNRPFEAEEKTPARVQRFLKELLARHDDDDRVAIVTHGGFFYALLVVVLGVYPEQKRFGSDKDVWFAVHNTSVTRINFGAEHVNLGYVNRIDFLPPHLIT